MLYEVSHFIQGRLPELWEFIEWINSFIFYISHRNKLNEIPAILESYSGTYQFREAIEEDLPFLVSFFDEQPKEAYTFFNPHIFDARTIKKLIRRKSFLFYVVESGTQIVGYFFIRCFFNGKCFRGKIVDYRFRGRGIATIIGRVSMDIASVLGMRMFGTISQKNQASLLSASSANDIRVIKELPGDYLYIEFLKKGR